MRNPSYFFDASPEHALINPDNLHILLDHIKCAAFELPFSADERFGREDVQEVLGVLAEEGFVHRAGTPDGGDRVELDERVVSGGRRQPSVHLVRQLRGRRHDARRERHRRDGFHERPVHAPRRKPSTSSKASCFRWSGWTSRAARRTCAQIDCDYYTDAITYTRVTILDVFASEPGNDGIARRSHGEVHVVSRVVGFKKIKFYTNENVGSGELDLPEQQMHTTAYWLTLPRELMSALPFGADDRRDGVVGLAFAMRQVAQLLLMCDRHDIGISIGAGDDTPATRSRVDGGASAPISTSRACSSTTTIRAASGSASRCSACTTSCWRTRAS